jgi:hypothetical protein
MAGESRGAQAAVDSLYALPLDEFTAARDDLARRLRREGEPGAAEEVKRLRKPTVAAWALNKARRSNRRQVDQLIDAGRRLREAQDKLVRGGGREQLDRASDDERRLVAELARQAERELAAAGRPVSGTVQEKIRGTLHAAASDPEAREGLVSGQLVREHAPSALGPLFEADARSGLPPDRGRRKRPREDGALDRNARQLEERLERSMAAQREADEELSDSRRRLRDARRAAARAASALERAEAAEERARQRLQQRSERAAELEAALRELDAKGGGRRSR